MGFWQMIKDIQKICKCFRETKKWIFLSMYNQYLLIIRLRTSLNLTSKKVKDIGTLSMNFDIIIFRFSVENIVVKVEKANRLIMIIALLIALLYHPSFYKRRSTSFKKRIKPRR